MGGNGRGVGRGGVGMGEYERGASGWYASGVAAQEEVGGGIGVATLKVGAAWE